MQFHHIFNKWQQLIPFLKITSHFSNSKHSQTIYALSSGVNSAISIVRVSGLQAYRALSLLGPQCLQENINRQSELKKFKIIPRQMLFKKIYGPTKGLIDQCLLVFFQANHSYSGQDLIEFHVHGSRAVVLALFQQLDSLKFRMAKKGQFTRRAVLNGRMNLQQAEAINDLVSSQLEFERQVAINNLLGKNRQFLDTIRKQLISCLAHLEAFIEFEQDQVDINLFQQTKKNTKKISLLLNKVIESSKALQTIKEGVKVSIVGRPNVGKSTLINAITKKDVSIVSAIPGTTRDLIQSTIDLNGYRLQLVDTAGLRKTSCPIENQGIRRTKNSIAESHINIVMLQLGSSKFYQTQNTIMIELHQDQQKIIELNAALFVLNKADQLTVQQSKKQIMIVNDPPINVELIVSLQQELGVEKILQVLTRIINQRFNLYKNQSADIFFTRARYLEGLQRCLSQLNYCINSELADLSCAHLREACRSVEQLVGRVDSEEVLDNVFSSFCIGK